jgi:hypothetical protein
MIRVFVRQSPKTTSANNTARPLWFTKQIAFDNLIATSGKDTEINVLFDGVEQQLPGFLEDWKGNLFYVGDGGSETKSFRWMIDFILTSKRLNSENDIIYLLEDDYVHRRGWSDVLQDGMDSVEADYFTLYDHADKYSRMYAGLSSQITVSRFAHWRTVPSTTNTYASRLSTLRKDRETHLYFSEINKPFSDDHAKFLELRKQGRSLVSSIPGYSTHCATDWLAPVVHWVRELFLV